MDFADLHRFLCPESVLLRRQDCVRTRECICRIWGIGGERVGSGALRTSPPVSGKALNAIGSSRVNGLSLCGLRHASCERGRLYPSLLPGANWSRQFPFVPFVVNGRWIPASAGMTGVESASIRCIRLGFVFSVSSGSPWCEDSSCGLRCGGARGNCSSFLLRPTASGLRPAGKSPGRRGFWLTPGHGLCKIVIERNSRS